MSNKFTIENEVVCFFGYLGDEDEIEDTSEKRNIAKVYEYAVKRGAMFSKHAVSLDDDEALQKAKKYRLIAETLGHVLIHDDCDSLFEMFKQGMFDEIEDK